MPYFKKLPGYTKTPAGRERLILRLLPKVLVFGTLLLCVPSLIARALQALNPEFATTPMLPSVDIYVIGLVILHWTVVLTVGIGAFIVMVMKGPAYVADAYLLDEADKPRPPAQTSASGKL